LARRERRKSSKKELLVGETLTEFDIVSGSQRKEERSIGTVEFGTAQHQVKLSG